MEASDGTAIPDTLRSSNGLRGQVADDLKDEEGDEGEARDGEGSEVGSDLEQDEDGQ